MPKTISQLVNEKTIISDSDVYAIDDSQDLDADGEPITKRVAGKNVMSRAIADSLNNVMKSVAWIGDTSGVGPHELFTDGGAIRLTIDANSAVAFDLTACAKKTGASTSAAYKITGLIKRDGVGTTTLVSSSVVVIAEDDAAWGIAVAADNAHEALVVNATGKAGDDIRWTVAGFAIVSVYA